MDAENHHITLHQIHEALDYDPQAYLRLAHELLKVRDRTGQIVPLTANAAQLDFERHRGRQNIVLKARQMGMTTWIAARFFLRTIAYPGTLTVQVAHTRSAAEAIFRTVQRMWEHLPEDLRLGELVRSRANVRQMVFPTIDSEFRVVSACDEGAGRGMSIQNLHCSELSRWPGDAAETLAGLRAALAPHGELVLESTPNGAYGCFYKEWSNALDDPQKAAQQDGLVRHFLPWWMEPAYIGPAVEPGSYTPEECLLVARHTLSAQQVGFRRSLESSYGALRSQEFAEDAETCFRATGDCCFEVAAIEERLKELVDPVEVHRNGALQIFWPQQPNRDYILAADTAGGGSDGDFAAVQVIDIETGRQCAELQQRLRPADLAYAIEELAKRYNDALVVVERNNHGGTVLAFLQDRIRRDRLYHHGSEAGWLTSSASKPEAISRLGVLLAQRPEMFASRRLLSECRTYISGEHGRTAAAAGEHDDLVISMAIAQTVRTERLNRC
jgi:hypothetical protein